MHSALRKLIVGALLAGGVAFFALVRDDVSPEGLMLVDLRASDGAGPGESAPSTGEAEVELDATEVDASESDAPRVLHGRVLDVDGAPIEGASVRRAHPYLPALEARSDHAGEFELHLDTARGELELPQSEWLLLGGLRHIDPLVEDDHVLVVAPRGAVAGQVVDARGAPVADALVRLSPPADALVRFGIASPPVELDTWRVWTSSQGGFRFDDAPLMRGVTLAVEHAGAAPITTPVLYIDGRAQVLVQLAPGR